MFWAIYWAVSAGFFSIPFAAGALALQLLPYSPDLAYASWLLSFILLLCAGYGAVSIVVGQEAAKKGYLWNLFFWLSIGLTPFLMGIIVANLPSKKGNSSVLPRVCIGCQRPLLAEARFCSTCGRHSPLLVEPTEFVIDFGGPYSGKNSADSTRTGNLIGGIGALLGSLILLTFCLIAADLPLGTEELKVQELLYLAALGLGLLILGLILLQRGLKAQKNQVPRD